MDFIPEIVCEKEVCKISAILFRLQCIHDDVIKWKHFPRYWPSSCAGNSPVTGEFPSQRSVMRSYFLWSAPWINGWVSNREVGDLRRHRAHYDVILMDSSSGCPVSAVSIDSLYHITFQLPWCFSAPGNHQLHCSVYLLKHLLFLLWSNRRHVAKRRPDLASFNFSSRVWFSWALMLDHHKAFLSFQLFT